MKLLGVVICFLCVNFLVASETYKAGVVNLQNKEISEYTPHIYEAGKIGVDILVLPSLKSSKAADNYDESIKAISKAAKQAGLYVVAHLYEKMHCQMGEELVRSNVVFDRKGSIVADYRKPVNGFANCTTSASDLVTFTADFGVTFGVLMEEDIVLYDGEHMRGVKNFVMTGVSQSEVAFLDAAYFAPSWSYITETNLVSSNGVYSGKAGLKSSADILAVADLHKNGGNDHPSVPTLLKFPVEDLSDYVIKPLDLAAASKGYKETVCHRSFCCEYYIKTHDAKGTKPVASYSLAAFTGVRPFSSLHNIGAHICAMYSTCGNNHKTCEYGSENGNTKVFFERIHITANFTKRNAQYPIVHSTAVLPVENFRFDAKSDGISQQVTLEIVDSANVVNFGIFGKDFAKENFVSDEKNSTDSKQNDIYGLIFNEDVQEIVDYLWIRLRVLIVVVSIYILEML